MVYSESKHRSWLTKLGHGGKKLTQFGLAWFVGFVRVLSASREIRISHDVLKELRL